MFLFWGFSLEKNTPKWCSFNKDWRAKLKEIIVKTHDYLGEITRMKASFIGQDYQIECPIIIRIYTQIDATFTELKARIIG